ncbi:MAG: glycosyltransferase [Gemmatimonadetes bacterium]|nr:glycosyltransferase [Gemmatimonadota bacterium]
MSVDISVVVATHNQMERLRLVLYGLTCQRFPKECFEVIVVDDGSSDGTDEMLTALAQKQDIQIVSLRPNMGRCLARNAGVERARGELVAFLDGDALPHPAWLARLWEAWEQGKHARYLCGFMYSLPLLEYLPNPQQAVFDEKHTPSVLADFLLIKSDRVLVTEHQIRNDFASIHTRAQEGGYPFAELKTVQDQVAELYVVHPDSPIGFLGFYPHNSAVPRQAFLDVGSFAAHIPFSEGWDLAYRLQQAGVLPDFVRKAFTYHLYHYHEFSDPSKLNDEQRKRIAAVAYMVQQNRNPKLWLIELWRAGIWQDPFVPEELILRDLVHFHQCYQQITPSEIAEIEILLTRHPLWKTYTAT